MIKDILSLWLFQTLLLLVLEYITICRAVERMELEDLVRNYYEEPNIYNRRGYGERYNDNRADLYYAAYADEARRTNLQDLARTDTKFTKPANLRKNLYSDVRSAYNSYGNIRNGDIDEIEFGPGGDNSAEHDFSNNTIILEGGPADNTMSNSQGINIMNRANFVTQSASCTCEGSDPNEEISFLCFSSKDGSENLSIKYKGTTMFNIEDIMRAYKFYSDNMQAINFNFDKKLKGESNLKNKFEGNSKFNFDVSTFNNNNGNLDLNSESEINKANKFSVNRFEKVDTKTIKKGTNEFNFDFIKSIDREIANNVNENNKFNTQFENNGNSNFNLETNTKVETWKQTGSKKRGPNEFNFDFMKSADQESEHNVNVNNEFNNQFKNDGNSNFNLETNTKIETLNQGGSQKNSFNLNQYSFSTDVQTDAQDDFEAEAKAKAIAKAQAFLQAKAEATAKAQAEIQKQMIAQAEAEAEAKAQAMAEALEQAKLKLSAQASMQAQVQAQAFADAQASAQAKAQASAQANLQGSGLASSHAHAYAQGSSQGNAQAQAQSFSQSHSHSHSFGLSGGNAGGLFGNGLLANGVQLGVGGFKKVLGGFNLGLGGGFGVSKQVGFGAGGFRSGAFGISDKSALDGNDGVGMGKTTYTATDINYGDDLSDENVEDGYVSTGYPGVLAYPAPSDSPVINSYSEGINQNDEFAFGAPAYRRYH